MNQTASHSQTPEFGIKKIATTQALFQHPKPEEMRVSAWTKTKAVLKEVAAIGLIAATVGSVTLTVHSCSSDADRQHAAAVNYQAQFNDAK